MSGYTEATLGGKNLQRARNLTLVGICLVLGLGLVVGCASSSAKPTELCLSLQASSDLNRFDGQAHVLVVHLFPLETSLGFEQQDTRDLLTGTQPAGLKGKPIQVMMTPGESKELRELLPAGTSFVGVVADYYRAPGEAERGQSAVVPARCGFAGGGATVSLGAREIQLGAAE